MGGAGGSRVRPTGAIRAAISALEQRLLDDRGVGCEEWEREIDERMDAFNGL
jgi:hypothetical protein